MLQGNIFSFSSSDDNDDDDELERAQQNRHQNRRSEKLRVQSGLEVAVAASQYGHTLVPIEEEVEDEEEEEQEEGGIYGAPSATRGINMLSEMFNYGGPADVLATAAAAHAHETSTNPPAGYHRMIQQIRPDFYGSNNRPQGLAVMSNTSATANIINTNNWISSSSVLIDQDHAAALAAAKQHGLNSAANDSSSPSSSTAMRLFFMNPPPSAGRPSNPPNRHDDPHQSPMGPATLHHHHHHDQSQAFLGGGDGASIFGEGVSFGGGMRESQVGPSLSLSSSLQQLEMRKAEELRGVRSQSGSAAASLLFYNSQQQQEQQLHTTSIQQPPQPPSTCLQSHAGHQSQGQYQQLHMSSSSTYGSISTANVLRNSKYARAAQELLEEFCSVSRGHVRGNTTGMRSSSINPNLLSHGGRGVSSSTAAASSSSSKDIPALSPADRFENQRKKSKLLSMLDEVEKRYNHYCEQMQMVVNSFDSVMGFGAAMPYTALARKAMSRHFRCLKDAITVQLKQACELLGDNDGGSGSGLTKGETPKLRLIDQNLRQQRAFHQMGMMEQEAWRPQRGLPDRSVSILRSWLFEHFLHPYPSDADKHLLARKTGLSRNQVSNWFINARVRLWKPMVEDMYQQEAQEEDSQINEEDQETNAPHRILLAAAPTTQQQQQKQPSHSPESDAPPETHVSIPSRPQLEHYGRLRHDAPQTHDQPAPPPHDLIASNSLIFPPPTLDDEMYRRAAATAAARTGDLSLTLGLRHAGGNAPDAVGRFGL
ncbi:hypothetical protein KFK09_006011 [Dendrobium nobile]|uniref:Homeobox domain-containing protein n=1 Tax=Dendrobium nobile TaxID=94219 RepID=A0A8T3C2N4_DENNO|nr:hypothetical protein KFK09_006011 [Dendrobium nobile]